MKGQDCTLQMPPALEARLAKIAHERCCTLNDLLDEQISLMIEDAEYRLRMEAIAQHLDAQFYAGELESGWPTETLECLAVAWIRWAYMEKELEKQITEMSAEDLEYWENEVKRCGRSFEELMRERIYGQDQSWRDLPDETDADWWKEESAEC
jgi:hypothetical protein